MKRGEKGEEQAVNHLLEQGCRIAERNWRSGRKGEIDIIAYDGEVLVFVEVKTRSRGSLGGPLEAVTAAKRKQLTRLATDYLYRTGLYGRVDCRFDVVGIMSAPGGVKLEHIRDAFRG
ncbi:MAG TPA: YraN family protein [candidate division Zixibacteria bacterium]|jgi:putative endonuclease|nr:YraN family protein [candidate division Zixibacteria bacterium]